MISDATMSINICVKPTLGLTIPQCFLSSTKDHARVRPRPPKSKALVVSTSSSRGSFGQTPGGRSEAGEKQTQKGQGRKRVFFLDVNPLCYSGSRPSLESFAYWASLLLSQVSVTDPLIAVLDGERGNEQRRALLPSYKAHRQFFTQTFVSGNSVKGHLGRSQIVADVLRKCNVPVVRVDGYEADDVVATLTEQVLHRGYKVVIASPDKDFKQLISDDVQMVLPIMELKRWSFYTIKHYVAQHNCDPQLDLSLRCMMGDEVDNVPGIQTMVPGFGRKTALKLLKKHGSLENLLNAAAVRTVGKQYAQDALTKHADFLRRNYRVLALKRDVNVDLEEEWLVERDTCSNSFKLSCLLRMLEGRDRTVRHGRYHSLNG